MLYWTIQYPFKLFSITKGQALIKYQISDNIYHPQHGIGTIEKFDTKELLGSEHTFAILFFPREDLTLSLPTKKLEGTIREPLSSDKAQDLLQSLGDQLEPLSSNWKIRHRNNQERMSSGEPEQLFAVYRGLQSLKDKKGGLNNSDRKQLSLSLDLLVEEFSIALGKSVEQTQALIEQTAT